MPREIDEWEASDHITALKAVMPANGEADAGVCPQHGKVFRALIPAIIWVVRRIDKSKRTDTDDVRAAVRAEFDARFPARRNERMPSWLTAQNVFRAAAIAGIALATLLSAYRAQTEATQARRQQTAEQQLAQARAQLDYLMGLPLKPAGDMHATNGVRRVGP